jgi:hypothetical protein
MRQVYKTGKNGMEKCRAARKWRHRAKLAYEAVSQAMLLRWRDIV